MRPVEPRQPQESITDSFAPGIEFLPPPFDGLAQCKVGEVYCAQRGGQTLTLYWTVITPDGCDGCPPLSCTLSSLPAVFMKRHHPTSGINTAAIQGTNLEAGPGVGREFVPSHRWTRAVMTHRSGWTTGCGSLKVRSVQKATSIRL